MKLHVEGMGLLGSLIAVALDQEGLRFTWNDTSEKFSAWPACTGAIYPAGAAGSLDWECYTAWEAAAEHPALRPHLERADYVFNHQKPPHGGRYDVRDEGTLRVAEPASLHFNAQTFVPEIRQRFRKYRVEKPVEDADLYLVAHGFSARRTHAYWGWTRRVKLAYRGLDVQRRPCIYLRRGRFVMCYAYPVPGEPWWYAGSSLIKQRTLRELEMSRKYARWKEQLTELTDGLVRVVEEGPFSQGWRPAETGLEFDLAHEWLESDEHGLVVPPLWHSGVRHAPKVLTEIADQLEIKVKDRVFHVDHC